MLELAQMIEIKILHQQGKSIRQIAKLLCISRNTVKRYLVTQLTQPTYHPRPERVGKLSGYEAYLIQRQQAAKPDWIPATVLYREICSQGYTGSLSLLRQFLFQLKVPEQLSEVIRYETSPGKQMQIDWAEFRQGRQRLCALIATLGYSRMSYVEFADNEQIDSLLSCLSNAFDYFGGVTEQLLFDNMKTVVTQRNAYGEGHHRFHKKLWDFAKHYGFVPKLCYPYRAQTKGKVERFIGYLRHSFYVPLRSLLAQAQMIVDLQTANSAVKQWLNSVANCRYHASLQQRPVDLFEQEKLHLIKLAPQTYPLPKTQHAVQIQNHPLVIRLPYMDKLPQQHGLVVYQQLLNQYLENNHEFNT